MSASTDTTYTPSPESQPVDTGLGNQEDESDRSTPESTPADDGSVNQEDESDSSIFESAPVDTSPDLQGDGSDSAPLTGEGQCEEHVPARLTAAPAVPADLAHIFPLGLMSGAHVTPVDHQYYYWDELQTPLDRYPVFSPADGFVVSIMFLENDYIVFIEHSCDLFSEFIHLETLQGPLAELNGVVTFERPWYGRVPVEAGEVIALDGGTNGFDFSIFDYSATLPGFINPASYKVEPWKIHTVDPFDYFEEPVRSQLLAMNVRQIEPLGGKIDYDIPGRLMGNWFVAGTNGYAGRAMPSEPIKPNQQIGYWNTHLAIAPDPIDPSVIIVSMGWFDGATAQLAIRDANPPPEQVSVETGLVKYELVDWEYVHADNGQSWFGITRKAATDIKVRLGEEGRGTVLFQLQDEDHLIMEAFPGMLLADVVGFTANAQVYER